MQNQNNIRPPRIAAFILSWLVQDYFDTPLGDFEEFYTEMVEKSGVRKARWWYRGQVLRLLPDQLFQKFFWGIVMLKNYFLVGVRNLRKDKISSIINIVGLSAAIGCAIALFLFILVINTHDDFHENGDHVFLIGHTTERVEGNSMPPLRWGASPVPLGPELEATYPQIERAIRYSEQDALVRADGAAFREEISFVDIGFFELLTFPLARGQETALEDANTVIISQAMAQKYFTGDDPMGQQLTLRFDDGTEQSMLVGGIAEQFPETASLSFDFLVRYENRLAAGLSSLEDWRQSTDATFIQMRDLADVPYISDQLGQYVKKLNDIDDSQNVSSFFLDSVQHPDFLSSWTIRGRVMEAPRLIETGMFAILGILMLMVACFNFVTIALGSAAGRLKEIGIRKTTGADKSQLIAQFLVENYILCFVAILGGIVFAWSATIPFINSMVVFDIPSGYFSNVKLWIFLGGLLVFIGLVSGAYPAFYISKFQPVEILRGTRKIAEKKTLTRALTTVQFVLTIITISFSTFVGSLDESLSQDDWGYDESSIVVMPVENDEHFSELHRAAGQVPNVELVAGTNHHIGATISRVAVHVDASDQRAYYFSVGPSYLTTMGVRVENGRAFGESHSTADSASVVVNKSFVSAQDWNRPIGRSLRIGEQSFTIVGVVDDVLLDPILGKHEPVIFGLSRPDRFNRLVLRVANRQLDQVTDSMRRISEEKFPEIVFSSYRQEEVLENEFQGLSVFMGYVAAFALLISCMGLFGLASQKVSRRIKEIGVRKAMGASAGNIIFLVNREFLIMLGTATMIATPLCYFVFSNSFFRFTEVELPTNLTPYILANLLVFMVAAISLSTQSYRLMNVIPADVLRYD